MTVSDTQQSPKKGFENVPCGTCQTPMFGGWTENPLYRGNEESMVELYMGYCPKCGTVVTDVVRAINLGEEGDC